MRAEGSVEVGLNSRHSRRAAAGPAGEWGGASWPCAGRFADTSLWPRPSRLTNQTQTHSARWPVPGHTAGLGG